MSPAHVEAGKNIKDAVINNGYESMTTYPDNPNVSIEVALNSKYNLITKPDEKSWVPGASGF